MSTWVVQARHDGQWRAVPVNGQPSTPRFMDAWRVWAATPDARLVRNGRPLRIRTPVNQLDLFNEED